MEPKSVPRALGKPWEKQLGTYFGPRCLPDSSETSFWMLFGRFWMLFGRLFRDVGLILEPLLGENSWNIPKDVKDLLMPEFLNSWIPGFLKAASPFFPPTSHTQHPLLFPPKGRAGLPLRGQNFSSMSWIVIHYYFSLPMRSCLKKDPEAAIQLLSK